MITIPCIYIGFKCYSSFTGQCLAGAGGGGFMYVITKDEFAMDKIKAEIDKVEVRI